MKTVCRYIIAPAMLFSFSQGQTISSDDFNQFNLKRNIWTYTDPVGDGTMKLVGTNTPNARLSLSVPAFAAHDIWTSGNKAPRITQPAPDSNFTIQAKFESPESVAFQIQGILVESTPTNFLRFDFYSDGAGTNIYAANLNGPSATQFGNLVIGAVNIQPLYMRISRVGNLWTQSYSLNDTAWTTAVVFSHTMQVTRVGLYVGNADLGGGNAPAHTVLIDYFQNNASPIVGEDSTIAVDVLPPYMYNIHANATSSSIEVNWKTDEPATGRVQYGLTSSYELGSINHINLVNQHSLQINGLQNDTVYHYRIISGDIGNRLDTTTDLTVRTSNPYLISNIVVRPTSASATITWTTLISMNSRVVYGTTAAYGDTLRDSTRSTSHFLNLIGLTSSTLYHFKVISTDSLNNSVASGDSTFSTIAPTTIVSDEFNGGSLNTSIWTAQNISGDATFAMTGSQCSIQIPAGSRHDVWNDLNNAPRIRQNCNNADFELKIKFDSGLSQGFQIQGLIVQQDSANFVRFDFNSDGASTVMFCASFTNSVPTIRLNQLVIDTVRATPLYMRITREGASWKQAYSRDGVSWTTGLSFIHILNVSSVALFSGNSGGNPAFTSLIDYFHGPPSVITIAKIKIRLEGAYDAAGDSMRTDVSSFLPLHQPYNIYPWNYAGAESVAVFPRGIVDWVLVELRTGTPSATKVATHAAFVMKDGSIVDTSGTGGVMFINVPLGNYYVVIYHRNHLAIMSAQTLALNGLSTLFDFSSSSSQAYGTAPLKQLSANCWGMYAGDVDKSGAITMTDANLVLGGMSSSGYTVLDLNYSGIVSATDLNFVFGNLNKSSQVP